MSHLGLPEIAGEGGIASKTVPLASSTLRPNWPLAHLPAPGCLERLRDQCRSLSSALEDGNERWSRRLCAYERLLTSLNGNLLFARAARTFCGEKGSIRSEARLASRLSQHLS